jgi:hypothetical protein
MINAKKPNFTGLTALLGVVCTLAAASPAAAQSRDPVQLLAEADANDDGAVSWSEVVALRTRNFERLDRNRDGFIAANDRPRGFYAGRFDEAFAQVQSQFDANADQRVSRAEMINAPSPVFDQGDVDGNRVLSAQELRALRTSLAPE